ncbi:MAG: TRAP transporter TatT component family protein [Desulfococcaceae bacterium]
MSFHFHRCTVKPSVPGFGHFSCRIYILALCFSLFGCVSSLSGKFAENLSHAVVNNNDLETVKTGGPAYLLMIDGLLRDDPDNEDLLRAAANLYTAYTDMYVEDRERAGKLTEKALDYAFRALCAGADVCGLRKTDFTGFTGAVHDTDKNDVPFLFTLGSAWAGWIQARQEDWNAVADISRVEILMQRVVELDETYQDGAAHLYLGILSTLIPPALGGKPDEGRRHFERAMEISGGKNFMIMVNYARQYARLVFDRELHDRLLRSVVNASPETEGYTLLNTLARQQARELLENADDYF